MYKAVSVLVFTSSPHWHSHMVSTYLVSKQMLHQTHINCVIGLNLREQRSGPSQSSGTPWKGIRGCISKFWLHRDFLQSKLWSKFFLDAITKGSNLSLLSMQTVEFGLIFRSFKWGQVAPQHWLVLTFSLCYSARTLRTSGSFLNLLTWMFLFLLDLFLLVSRSCSLCLQCVGCGNTLTKGWTSSFSSLKTFLQSTAGGSFKVFMVKTAWARKVWDVGTRDSKKGMAWLQPWICSAQADPGLHAPHPTLRQCSSCSRQMGVAASSKCPLKQVWLGLLLRKSSRKTWNCPNAWPSSSPGSSAMSRSAQGRPFVSRIWKGWGETLICWTNLCVVMNLQCTLWIRRRRWNHQSGCLWVWSVQQKLCAKGLRRGPCSPVFSIPLDPYWSSSQKTRLTVMPTLKLWGACVKESGKKGLACGQEVWMGTLTASRFCSMTTQVPTPPTELLLF